MAGSRSCARPWLGWKRSRRAVTCTVCPPWLSPEQHGGFGPKGKRIPPATISSRSFLARNSSLSAYSLTARRLFALSNFRCSSSLRLGKAENKCPFTDRIEKEPEPLKESRRKPLIVGAVEPFEHDAEHLLKTLVEAVLRQPLDEPSQRWPSWAHQMSICQLNSIVVAFQQSEDRRDFRFQKAGITFCTLSGETRYIEYGGPWVYSDREADADLRCSCNGPGSTKESRSATITAGRR